MNWLLPGFLAGAGLIGLPVLLHFLRSKPKAVVPFPSLRFLGQTAIRDTRRHRLRRLITLLLRCLAICFLAAAFARPFWIRQGAAAQRAMVIAIDNSMSMQTANRWEAMRTWALRQMDELKTGDQAALLVMNPTPKWLLPMTDDLARVRSTLQAAQPGFEKTHYGPAIRVAGDTLAANPAGNKTLVWMADEQRAGWLGVDFEHVLPPGVKIRVGETAPEPRRQAAIVALERLTGMQDGVSATVRLFAPQQDSRRIAVQAGKKVLAEKTVTLRAGDNKVELAFVWPQDVNGLRVSLDADDLPADDTAWIAARKSAAGGVVLDSVTGADFLAHAFLSTQKLNEGGLTTSVLPDKAWPQDCVVVARDAATFKSPRVERLDSFVNAGGPLWIFVNGAPEQTEWLKKHGVQVNRRVTPEDPWHLRDWDPDHPALAAFSGQSLLPLLEVEFYQGFDLNGDVLAPIANWPDGKTAIAEWSGGGHRILLAGFPLDRDSTDWPARASFVPFVHQAARWLGSFAGLRSDWRVGDTIPLTGAGTWRAIDTATPQKERKVSGGAVRPEVPGLYEFVPAGQNTARIFAVNIPPEESDLAPWPNQDQLIAMQKPDAPARAHEHQVAALMSNEAAENQQRLWWWLLAIAGVAILSELALANRTAM